MAVPTTELDKILNKLAFDAGVEAISQTTLGSTIVVTASKAIEKIISEEVVKELEEVYGCDDIVYYIETRLRELRGGE